MKQFIIAVYYLNVSNNGPFCIFVGDFQLSQTPVICKYLGEKYGLVPEKEEDKWHAEMMNTQLHDYLAEGKCTHTLYISVRVSVHIHCTSLVLRR